MEVFGIDGFGVRAFGFSLDGRRLAILSLDMLSVHDIATKTEVFRTSTRNMSSTLFTVGFTEDGLTILATDEYLRPDKPRFAWSLESSQEVSWPNQPAIWDGRGLSRDGSKFHTGGWPGPTPRIFDSTTRNRITYCYHEEWPVFVSFTPDSRNLVTLHENGNLFFWELRDTDNDNAKKLRFAKASDLLPVSAMALLKRSNEIAYADGEGRVWTRPIHWQSAEGDLKQ